MMSNNDKETFFRMTLSRMQLARDEIIRLRREVYDCEALAESKLALDEAIALFLIGRDAAIGEFGFVVKDSMPT